MGGSKRAEIEVWAAGDSQFVSHAGLFGEAGRATSEHVFGAVEHIGQGVGAVGQGIGKALKIGVGVLSLAVVIDGIVVFRSTR